MRDEHIINILESAPLASLGESDLATIRAHAGHCTACRQAFEAAQISALLLKEHVAEAFEPSPFFQTRVLAALRERQASAEMSGFRRLWKATAALVTSMAATVAALAVLTFLAPVPQPESPPQELAAVVSLNSAEEMLLAQDSLPDDELSDAQVLATLYGSEEDTVR